MSVSYTRLFLTRNSINYNSSTIILRYTVTANIGIHTVHIEFIVPRPGAKSAAGLERACIRPWGCC